MTFEWRIAVNSPALFYRDLTSSLRWTSLHVRSNFSLFDAIFKIARNYLCSNDPVRSISMSTVIKNKLGNVIMA